MRPQFYLPNEENDMSWIDNWATGLTKKELVGCTCKLLVDRPPKDTQLGGIKNLDIHVYDSKKKRAFNTRILCTQQDIDAMIRLHPRPFTWKEVKGFDYPRVVEIAPKS